MTRTRPTIALPALLTSNAILAFGPWLVRLSRSEGGVGPIAAGFWRVVIVLPLVIALAWFIERPKLDRRAVLLTAVAGLAFASDLALWHIGILHTRLANATLLGNIASLTFPLYGFWIARAWPRPRQWIALALAAAGGALLLGRSYSLSADNLIGDLACVGAGLFYLVYLIAIERSGNKLPLTALAICGTVGSPLLLLVALASGESVWPRTFVPLATLSFGSQLIGQGLLLFGVARATPLLVGILLLSQPVIAGSIGWVFYGERLTLPDIAGALAIGIAVILVRDARKPESLPPPDGSLSSPT